MAKDKRPEVQPPVIPEDPEQLEAFKLTILEIHLRKAVQKRDHLKENLFTINDQIELLKLAIEHS